MEDGRQEEDAEAGVFAFIKGDSDVGAAAKGDAGFGDDAADRGFAFNGEDTGDLFVERWIVFEVVEAEHFAEGVAAFVDDGEVVE